MPKPTKQELSLSSSSRQATRRSSRLNPRSVIKDTAVVEVPDLSSYKRRRIHEDLAAVQSSSSACLNEINPTKNNMATRKSHRLSAADLLGREQALLEREQEMQSRTDELDARLHTILKKEDQVTSMVSQFEEREAKAALSQLEEHFTCPLCYEVMAHPYTLNPGQCGHSFCGICILKWFFSRLHQACGGWHESVDCPICRSLLVITPDRTPRLDITFPFVPNRLADQVLQSLVEKVSRPHTSGSGSAIKTEERELHWASSEMECGVKKGKTKEEEEQEATCAVSEWKESGPAKVEWQRKEREGRVEMDYLAANWTTLNSSYFVQLKKKLGV
ncbi:hypothetical protein HGRIS_005006 [Hohenbuehelia grisea]|uniref:RING-type domain-containing protein n=1 Tax=Hohenbuehelia grisea TaxID=104357 RepID=A0ABR3JE48_9AGAR